MLKKKLYFILIMTIISISLFNISFANNMIVALNINYGQAVTQSNYVTLNLDVKGQSMDLNNLKVQFSLDNKNWSGYNPSNQKWESGYFSSYQSFYSNFFIGYNSGLKTIYVKVIDSNGSEGLASAKISFSESSQDPNIITPQSTELSSYGSLLNKAKINSGSGSLYDPYIISSKNTKLVSKMSNVDEVSYYSIEDKNWSNWIKINDGQGNIPIVFDDIEGIKEVRIKTKNQYGIEGNPKIIYYLLDYSKPTINLHTTYHSFVALDGKLEFDLEIYDTWSNTVDFKIEIYASGSGISKEGKTKMYGDGRSTITTVTIKNLPIGNLKVKVTAVDEAGNSSTKQASINSI